MTLALPSLTKFDPAASSEGTLDPMGLYQIADQLATKLVPAVRERMQRIRFLTAMAVGALVTESLESDPDQPESPPFLIWEWLVVEAFIRSNADESTLKGVPGTQVTRRAVNPKGPGYLDHRSYLKTPRIFGFHGVYKRLASHLELVDDQLGPGRECESLVDAWARDQGCSGARAIQPLLRPWMEAVRRGMESKPCKIRPVWDADGWARLAKRFFPGEAGGHEKGRLKQLLHSHDHRALGALPAIWKLQNEFKDEQYSEERLHARLRETAPSTKPLLEAIAAYEAFCRSLQDGFDLIRASAGGTDVRGIRITEMSGDAEFESSVGRLNDRHAVARRCLGEVDTRMAFLFDERFSQFAEPMSAAAAARCICDHHKTTQEAKSAEGKREWFDRLGPDRIITRHRYREARRGILPGLYVHDYRARPIRNFYRDLC